MKFKKIIIFILFLLICLSCSNVFAAQTGELEYNGQTYTYSIPDEAKSFIIMPTTYYSDENILLYSTQENAYFKSYKASNNGRLRCYNSSGIAIVHYQIPLRFSEGGFTFTTSLSGYKQVAKDAYSAVDKTKSVLTGNCNLLNYDDSLFYDSSSFETEEYIFPYIADDDETLMELNTDYLLVMPGSLPNTNYINFTIIKVIDDVTSEQIFTLRLDSSSALYNEIEGEYWYEVPTSSFSNLLDKNSNYIYLLSGVNDVTEYTIPRSVFYVGLTEEEKTQQVITENFDKINNKLDEQQQQSADQFEEEMEVQKGIWETIKEILNFINPLSDSFFVYKLIDLLLDMLKSLFIPGNGFFTDYFNELMEWFSGRLGFLAYPLELILDILNRFLNINFNEPIISIPDISEPTTGLKLISATEYNLNSLLENDILKNVHNIYLIVIDAIIIFGLVNLLKHKLEEVMTK